MIGYVLSFWIARLWGRAVIEKFVAPETLNTYDSYVSNRSFLLFLMYFLPVFPDDELSYLAGISKMKFKPFLLANVFGHVGGSLSLAYIGSGIDVRDPLFWILFVGSFVTFCIFFYIAKKNTYKNY